MRIAVLDLDRCHPKKCSLECIKSCPGVRMGEETIVLAENEKPLISEELCTGCGICVKKCPFEAISIIQLPDELEKDAIQRYGENGFRLYRIPYPTESSIIGLIGQNGTGKTTIMKILSGELIPNLGAQADEKKRKADVEESKKAVLKRFSGKQFHNYFTGLYSGRLKTAYKPQYVDALAKIDKSAEEVLGKIDERSGFTGIVENLELENAMGKNLGDLSGGELQRVAIAACLLREADVYLLDEPSSYLDIKQRLNLARTLKSFLSAAESAEEGRTGKRVVVVEHDLVVLDYISDYVYALYGKPAVYGITSTIKTTREGINAYLNGYFREENIRIRGEEIKFEVRAPVHAWAGSETLVKYSELRKSYDGFVLRSNGGEISKGEVVGILGPNATGKTTFAKLLSGVIEGDEGKVELKVRISYKPQYIKPEVALSVGETLKKINPAAEEEEILNEIIKPLGIDHLFDFAVSELSGGELQRVAIAACLLREADVYLLDEPSAYLDVEQRLKLAKLLRRLVEKRENACLVVDHDMLFMDYISDRLIVFGGRPGKEGSSTAVLGKREGMNSFLSEAGITFRRDPETGRPRANKLGSRKDEEQKRAGEYYYEAV